MTTRKQEAAHRVVFRAVRSGRLVRPTACERCGESPKRIEAHHPDYDRPLDVLWLCKPCHTREHVAAANAHYDRYERIDGVGWYFRTCDDCGVELRDRKAQMGPRCTPCSIAARTIWTREAVIAAMRSFAQEFGRAPTAIDWNPALAERFGRKETANLYRSRGREWPNTGTVQSVFGSWSLGVEAAGLPRPRMGRPPKHLRKAA